MTDSKAKRNDHFWKNMDTIGASVDNEERRKWKRVVGEAILQQSNLLDASFIIL